MSLDVRIASPCSEKWDSMTGDERRRFCAKCQLHVYDLRQHTEAEVRALLGRSDTARVCGRVYRRFDGTVLLKDCPTGVAKLRKRLLLGLSAAATLVLAVLGFGLVRVKQCLVSPDDSWFDRTVGARVLSAREVLRETRTFGPLIDEYFPQERFIKAGKMIALPPSSPSQPE